MTQISKHKAQMHFMCVNMSSVLSPGKVLWKIHRKYKTWSLREWTLSLDPQTAGWCFGKSPLTGPLHPACSPWVLQAGESKATSLGWTSPDPRFLWPPEWLRGNSKRHFQSVSVWMIRKSLPLLRTQLQCWFFLKPSWTFSEPSSLLPFSTDEPHVISITSTRHLMPWRVSTWRGCLTDCELPQGRNCVLDNFVSSTRCYTQ